MLKTLLSFIVLLASILSSDYASAETDEVSYILMEKDTGMILNAENEDEQRAPASMTKMMTMLLLMEAIEEEEVSFDDKVTTSEQAASMGGSQIFLEPGEEMTVRDLLKAIAVASGNDASVAISEHLEGSEEAFVERMNERAEELGMKNTHFKNSNGLPADGHYSTAKDLAMLASKLLDHEEITSFTNIYEDYLRQGTDDEFWLVNTNRLVKTYEGMDGLKTGFTRESMYGLTATAKREDMRLIAVVMGAETPNDRNDQITGLLDEGFGAYKVENLFDRGQVITSSPVEKGMKENIPVRTSDRTSLLLQKDESREGIEEKIQLKTNLEAPIEEGEIIGELRLEREGEVLSSTELEAAESVESASWLRLFARSLLKLGGKSPSESPEQLVE
ncbi:D-alanyl-D-alanine carboxypeptidase family protein [Salsuginibacillus kocurii]|uniref:D-alanyl-D-alanine carboxypeptidase family protein n=1 Tax=Salsuginibacillus kocurii TaxID=427078 RepID=UPI00037C35AB|nr:D-alanyl-D-alanine carboxypeptidase family protein [Salsuginibacillus kocurii]